VPSFGKTRPKEDSRNGPRFLLRGGLDVHENQSVQEEESPDQKAIRLLNRQLGELQQTIRSLNNTDNRKFKAWRDSTRSILERFLGKESHY